MEEEFKIPEFDEEEFMKREKRKAKTTFISFSFGILMGIITHFLWINLNESIRWPLCFLLAIASIGFMAKILQILKIDIEKFSKKEWFGSIAFYFFTWLAIFILSINPPFYDASPPKIDAIALPHMQELGGTVLIIAKVSDNSGIKEVYLNITYNNKSLIRRMVNEEKLIYTYSFPDITNSTEKLLADEPGNFSFSVVAIDKKGNKNIWENGNFSFSKEVIYISQPENNSIINSSTEIKICLNKNVLPEKSWKNIRVFYKINGKEVNATYSSSNGSWYVYNTSAKYIGWEKGENVLHLCAEVEYYLLPKELNQSWKTSHGIVVDNSVYKFKVEGNNIGTLPSEKINMPGAKSLRAPAFELMALISAFMSIIFIRKKYQSRRQ